MKLKYSDLTHRLGRIGYFFLPGGFSCYPKVVNMDNLDAERQLQIITAKIALQVKTPFVLVITRSRGKPSWGFKAIEFSFFTEGSDKSVQYEDTWDLASGSMAQIYQHLVTLHEFSGLLARSADLLKTAKKHKQYDGSLSVEKS